jgi:hypothetical protein
MLSERDAMTKWVHELNKLATDIDDIMYGQHPTTWNNGNIKAMSDRWKRLARRQPKC